MDVHDKEATSIPLRFTIDTDPLPMSSHLLLPNVLAVDECMALREKYDVGDALKYGLVGTGVDGSYKLAPQHRLVRTANIGEDEQWLYERLTGIVRQFNASTFGFDLYGILDDISIARYDHDNGELGPSHFTWHSDAGAGLTALRKLSVVVVLSSPMEYEGGEFEIFNCGPQSLIPNQGSVILFPSYMQHRVRPLLSGRRYSLIAFVLGPRIK